ncbi:EF-hand domain-containing protein [Solidesulfovibrio sp.]|uniref:EF-hand domain-containing protein n=1 Tax=Solidesulfovibrio sp. TaxID=2910990 RepID=UPI002619E8BD|nr:EF-hand domain-containing protein [Solidesulfovibrio sp.]
MRKILMTAMLAGGLALGLAGVAAADEDMFKAMDANKDGVLTKDEFAAHGMQNDFAKYDKDGDGKVSREEFDAVEAAKVK